MKNENGVPAITDPWPVADVCLSCLFMLKKLTDCQIVYVAIMGTVMLAAFLEWFLWLAAFLYCLVKIYIKAEHWSIKIMAIIMMVGFTLLRYATSKRVLLVLINCF